MLSVINHVAKAKEHQAASGPAQVVEGGAPPSSQRLFEYLAVTTIKECNTSRKRAKLDK